MKRFQSLLVLICLSVLSFAHGDNHSCEINNDSLNFENELDSSNSSLYQTVVICTGSYSYAYHSSFQCYGLNNCKGNINAVSSDYAVYSLGRLPCCICWDTQGGRCGKDGESTGSYGGGGGGSSGEDEAVVYAAIAVVAVATSALILSNDIYYSPALSVDGHSRFGTVMTGFAHNFGLRKTFKSSALEYGGVYSSFRFEDSNPYYGGYSYTRKYSYWGLNLSFVHDLYKEFIAVDNNLYGGLSINGVNLNNPVGIGFILGDSYQLNDRFKADMRLFYSQKIFQVQLGLIFNYQKKYIWERWKENKK